MGGQWIFIGKVNVTRRLSEQYLRIVEMMIRQYEPISTDEQVLYVLGNSGQVDVRIKTYRTPETWIYLEYQCAAECKKRHQ